MIDPVRLSTKYVVDTDIIINTLKGVKEAVQALEKLEDDDSEIYYSTIVWAELFSFHELTTSKR